MRHLKRMRHRLEHGSDHVERQPIVVVAQQLGERHAFDIFHDQVRRGILDLEVVHRDDARVRQHGRRAGLVQSGMRESVRTSGRLAGSTAFVRLTD